MEPPSADRVEYLIELSRLVVDVSRTTLKHIAKIETDLAHIKSSMRGMEARQVLDTSRRVRSRRGILPCACPVCF